MDKDGTPIYRQVDYFRIADNYRPEPYISLSSGHVSGHWVKDPNEQPVRWDVSFQATGDKHLGVLIPFVGNAAMEPEVDIC